MTTTDNNVALIHKIALKVREFAAATKEEMELDHQRHVVKMQTIAKIVRSGDNPLTGKPHSFSSAELLVEQDPDYAQHMAKLREATEKRIIARGDYESALVEAQLVANTR